VSRDYRGYADAALTLTSSDGRTLVEADSSVEIDPFAERPDYDDAPWLLTALTHAVTGLVSTSSDFVDAVPRPGFELFANPAILLGAPGRDGMTQREVIAAKDPLEAERLLWVTLQSLRPTLEPEEARRLATLPPAACVGSAPPPPLAAGDCVIEVSGAPITGPHELGRALARGQPLAVTVVDARGERRALTLHELPRSRP